MKKRSRERKVEEGTVKSLSVSLYEREKFRVNLLLASQRSEKGRIICCLRIVEGCIMRLIMGIFQVELTIERKR
jgi:hypothetical protein